MRHYTKRHILAYMSINRLRELEAYTRQYEEWEHALKRGNLDAKAREIISTKAQIVEECAMLVDGGIWKDALIQCCGYGKPYGVLSPILPDQSRTAFYKARELYYLALNHIK